jgi:hypothetical protein
MQAECFSYIENDNGWTWQKVFTSQDAKVDLKPLIVAVIPLYCLSETIKLFFCLFLCVLNKLIIFSTS